MEWTQLISPEKDLNFIRREMKANIFIAFQLYYKPKTLKNQSFNSEELTDPRLQRSTFSRNPVRSEDLWGGYSDRPVSITLSHVKEELIGTVEADKAREIRSEEDRELERHCRVDCTTRRANAWDENKEVVTVGASEQNPDDIFDGDVRRKLL